MGSSWDWSEFCFWMALVALGGGTGPGFVAAGASAPGPRDAASWCVGASDAGPPQVVAPLRLNEPDFTRKQPPPS